MPGSAFTTYAASRKLNTVESAYSFNLGCNKMPAACILRASLKSDSNKMVIPVIGVSRVSVIDGTISCTLQTGMSSVHPLDGALTCYCGIRADVGTGLHDRSIRVNTAHWHPKIQDALEATIFHNNFLASIIPIPETRG
jgi:hypothetical protein